MLSRYVRLSLVFFVLYGAIHLVFQAPEGGASNVLVQSLKDTLSPFTKIYLDAFKSSDTSFMLFVLIVLSCIGVAIWMYFGKFHPAYNDIAATVERLNQADLDRDDERLVSHLDAIMGRSRMLDARWMVFRNGLVEMSRTGNKTKEVVSLSSPASQFNMEALEAKGLHLDFMGHIPGYFVGFGLVCTFAGLVAALYFTSAGIKTGDANQLREALANLIQASTFKFMTSVAGIGSSLLISILLQFSVNRIERRLLEVCDILQRLIPTKPFLQAKASLSGLSRGPSTDEDRV